MLQVLLNDGSQVYNASLGVDQQPIVAGTCSDGLLTGQEQNQHLRIKYVRGRLLHVQVFTHLPDPKGEADAKHGYWMDCFAMTGITLPDAGYIGMTVRP